MKVQRVVLASSNPGKLAELSDLLADSGLELVAQSTLGIPDIEETGATFVENALLKARHAAASSGLPAIADDSGLCVDALDGAPGLYSARYAGPTADAGANMARLLSALAGVPAAGRGAHFHCCIVLLRHAADPAPLLCEGTWNGTILEAPRGQHGFGYDPLFLDPLLDATAAELEPAAKHCVSHRGAALAQLRRQLARL